MNGLFPLTAALGSGITDKLVEFATNVIGDLGYAGVFVLMTLESALIPIPSEATMLFAGFKVDDGTLTLLGIVIAGVLGNLVGSWIAYAIGYYGRLELVERHRIFHANQRYLDWADDWFQRHGDATVFFSRMLPVIRTFISLPAGVARMPFWRFSWLTLLGCIPWVLALGLLGKLVGSKWDDWKDRLHYLDYLVLATIVALIVYAVVKRRRGRRTVTRRRGPAEADAGEQPRRRGGAAGEAEAPPVRRGGAAGEAEAPPVRRGGAAGEAEAPPVS